MDRRRIPLLPPRWLKCPRIGNMLINLIIPLKTPLDSKFTDAIPNENIFEPEHVFEYVKPVKLGLLIDLTKSNRFYHRREIENHDCKYVKIACKGNEETPTEEQVKFFISLVNSFEKNGANSDKKIGVHCTHGFNRTGFLIAAYLVEERNFSIECALQMFVEARPPGIYKADYIKELFNRYGDSEDCPSAPALPDWCFEDEDNSNTPSLSKRRHPDSPNEEDDDDTTKFQKLSNQGSSLPTCSISADANTSFLPPPGEPRLVQGLTGVRTLVQTSWEAHHAREVCEYFLLRSGVPRKNSQNNEEEELDSPLSTPTLSTALTDEQNLKFVPISIPPIQRETPLRFRGSQPVSMTRQNARLIVDHPYSVTYKSDGTRYLLLIHGPNKVYLIDRANFVHKVDVLHFPSANWLQTAIHAKQANKTPTDFLTEPGGHLVNCLVDSELVSFDTPDRPFKLLIYDAITILGQAVGRFTFEHRMHYIEKYIVRPRNDSGHNGFVDFMKQSFSVRKKPFFHLSHTAELLNSSRQTLLHETDGLIFQPAGPSDFYVLGTCIESLKWKPPELNTIDFRVKVFLRKAPGEINQYIGELYLGGSRVPTAHLLHVTSKDKSLDGKIVECTCDRVSGGWKVLRIRTDKTDPNHISVGKLIMESILYPVTAEDVVTLINLGRQLSHQRQCEKEERLKRETHSLGSLKDT